MTHPIEFWLPRFYDFANVSWAFLAVWAALLGRGVWPSRAALRTAGGGRFITQNSRVDRHENRNRHCYLAVLGLLSVAFLLWLALTLLA
jgi:hypothetical protein